MFSFRSRGFEFSGSTLAEALNNSAALFGFSLLFITSGYLEVVVLTQDVLRDGGLGQATVWGFGFLGSGYKVSAGLSGGVKTTGFGVQASRESGSCGL